MRNALGRGGVRELALTTRRWAAEVVYPGSLPTPSRRAARPRRTLNAGEASFEQATRYFTRGRAGYDALADAISPYLPSDGVLFDVGGNIGYFTKVVVERTGFKGSVHLFEPVPELAGFIPRTLAGLPIDVTVHNYGLGAESSEFELFLGRGNLGWNTLIAERATSDMEAVTVRVRRFDDVGMDLVPSLLKIDVEGAEYLVLRGMLPALARWTPRVPILLEVGWGGARHPAWEEELAVLDEVLALGYRATDLAGDPIDLRSISKTTDILLLPGAPVED